MKLWFRFTLIPSMVLLTSFSAAHAENMTPQIDQYMNAVVKVYHFMGAVLVARNGKVLIAKGYGMANLQHHVPNTSHTEFRIASITKQFTAMAILELQAKGKLSVDDPICKYVPDCPKDWNSVTIYNLLTHTSGIPNFTSFPDYKKVESQQMTPTQLLAYFKDKPLDFRPGTRFEYSNSGYAVLGYIIQCVSGEPYRQFLQQNIFEPLGMSASGYDSSHPNWKTHAKGYVYANGDYRPARYVNMSVPYSAGGLYSTVWDLYTWDRALEQEKLLPKSLLNQMLAPQVSMGTLENLHYGFGWIISKEFGYKVIWHEGGIAGFGSLNSWLPQQDTYVVVLDNVSSPVATDVARSLTAIVLGKKYEIPAAHQVIGLSEKELERFVGKYQFSPTFSIAITRAGDQLMEQATGESAFPIFPESKSNFFFKVVSVRMSFETSHNGVVTGMVLDKNGQIFHGEKVN